MNGRRVLLVVSADDASVTPAGGPRKDYRVLADALGADTLDRSSARTGAFMRRLARYVGTASIQAWLAFRSRNRYDVIVTDGEHIGLPLALLLKLTRSRVIHVTIGHRITAAKKRPFFKWLHVHTHLNRIAVHSRRQFELGHQDLGIPAEQLALIPYQVDTDFWQQEDVAEERMISSVGLEFRDYETLVSAIEGSDIDVVIGAASHWSRRRTSVADDRLPSNIHVAAFDYRALRRVYSRSSVVVVPLNDTDFQAGITTILEAMSMSKPVIVTHTWGQTDIVEDRRSTTRGQEPRRRPRSIISRLAEQAGVALEPTGFYVPPNDSEALRRAIAYLLAHPEVRRQLGSAGRRTVERFLTVDQFADRINALVTDATGQPGAEVANVRALTTDAGLTA